MSESSTISDPGAALYRTLWRWHFYAGLFCIPFVLALAVSGAIYLFKPQIDAFVDRPFNQLEASAPRSTANAQINAALAALPGSQFLGYQLPENNRQAVKISLIHQDVQRSVYVDPYTLAILQDIAVDSQFIQQIQTFHGELLAGNIGSVVVELAGCWAIVLVVTGLYLWWPRNGRGLGGVLYPRLRLRGRPLWRDIHGVIGIWISFFTLFLLVTGLPWALVWGSAFKELRQWNTPVVQQDWAVSRAQEHHHQSASSTGVVDLSENLLDSAVRLNLAPPVKLAPDNAIDGVWKVSSDHQNRPLRATAWLRSDSGELVRSTTFADKPLVDRVIGIGVAAHEGQLFGWFNQLLGVVTTLGLVVISVSGFVLWRKRKPGATLGAPIPLPDARAGKVVAAIMLALALVLPVLALSLLALFCLEIVVLRHLPASRRWLGLS